jgi:N-methylhydantoinase B/oxoprolinase/acetone carboxylase alpha subunit
MLAERTQTLKGQLEENDRLFQDTGFMYGMEELKRKAEDPGRYEAVWHILMNICNTAWDVGCRVSSSAIAVDGGDALWGLHLPTGEAVSISKGITAHPGLLSLFIRQLVEMDYESDPGIKHGDIFENNDSHYGGIHASDFDAAIPIFYDGELVAWASGVSHVMDCGGVLPGSIGFMNPDAFSDGVPVTMERVGENDKYTRWYEMRIASRTRMPDMVLGDARGRLAGMITIRDKVIEVIDKYGIDFFHDVIREYVEDGRRFAVTRVKTQTIPGRYRKSNFKDLAMQGKRVVLPQQNIDVLFNQPLEITINADASVKFSLAGASGWVPFGENITPTALTSALMNAYSHMVGFDMFNWGAVASWDLETPPEGSWANPYPANFFAASGVAWAPAVMWMSSMYETLGRLYYSRGFIEEVAAGAATTLCAEFSGVGQFGVYVAGLTLEQASNGAPARGMADGENSAWCIYTPNADFGNAEISESYYPIMYLGRNVEPDSGGYGTYRGGLGHTAVWMVKNTPGIEYQCGCAGIRSKIVANHGMYGAYPSWPDRAGYAIGSNVKELIDAQKPLVHERGDADGSLLSNAIEAKVLESNAVAPFVAPEQLHEYDLIVHPISGAQAQGDPLERKPELVCADLTKGWTREWVARDVYGVVARQDSETKEYSPDEAATAELRDEMRARRKSRGIPFREWWSQEREKVQAGEGMADAVKNMWRTSMELTPSYGDQMKAFWKLPNEFSF